MTNIGFTQRLLLAALCIHCGGAGPSKPSVPAEELACDSSTGRDCSETIRIASDTNWHPDPDGDGIPSSEDHCPNIYDLDQGDADGDGIGDFCDEDYVSLAKGGPIVDLRAQHVTPYGGWFGFTSPKTTRYGQDYVIAWSTKPGDVRSGKAIRRLSNTSKKTFRVFAYAGHSIVQPQIVTEMAPKTKYYVSVAPLNDYDKPSEPTSNIAEIWTAEAPDLALSTKSPRVIASGAQLATLRKRHQSGDRSWKKWVGVMGGSVLDAASSGSEHDFGECLSAALLYHGTKSKKYRRAALTLITSMRNFWVANELENNQLRWLLDRAGRSVAAGHARWHMDNLFPADDYGGTWAVLLFAHDGIAARGDNRGLATSFYD
ncbi:MAG: hypothetical protein GY811_09665 [Myxococcales bacterium]|nr:hypothetical protein [Myxococcales bacterium]